MPFPLHKSPRGLLDLFRLRTLGRNPDQFSELVIPVVDVRDFYGADLLQNTTGAPTVGAIGPLVETLAIGVTMRLRAIAARLVVGAAAITASGQIEAGITMGTGNVPLCSLAFGTAPVGGQPGVGCVVDGIVLEAGRWTAYAMVNGVAAGADHSLSVFCIVEPYLPN